MQTHPFPPVYDSQSKILILGSFPSVKSRETNFFYGHPRNRFWKLIARIVGEEVPTTIKEKKAMLLRNHIAVWDVIASCEITGSSDASIKNVIPNDLSKILEEAEIVKIFGNGATACKFYKKYTYEKTKREIIQLPSTSPANATWNEERLYEEWRRKLVYE